MNSTPVDTTTTISVPEISLPTIGIKAKRKVKQTSQELKEYHKNYRANHKDVLKEYYRLYNIINKDKITQTKLKLKQKKALDQFDQDMALKQQMDVTNTTST